MTISKCISWGVTGAVVVALLGGAVALVQSFLSPVLGPPRPISSGYTVYGAREELEKNILPLLE